MTINDEVNGYCKLKKVILRKTRSQLSDAESTSLIEYRPKIDEFIKVLINNDKIFKEAWLIKDSCFNW